MKVRRQLNIKKQKMINICLVFIDKFFLGSKL